MKKAPKSKARNARATKKRKTTASRPKARAAATRTGPSARKGKASTKARTSKPKAARTAIKAKANVESCCRLLRERPGYVLQLRDAERRTQNVERRT